MSRFPAPPEAMEEHSAIIGKTGAGKTYTAKGFAEDLLAEGARFCVIDPTGVWWGLKSSADGESEGFPVVVFGGDHGDVPLDENDAEAVARIVATTATPCVLDVSAFPSLAAQKRFMTDFAEHVFRMNKEALHLFVDEADAFMPQRPGPDEQVMLGRWDTIARRGRSRGFRLTLITQRPAVLNKNALSQVGTLIALKLTSPQDRKAVGDWIEGNADKTAGKALLNSLPGLNRGEGWVWSPGHDVLERVQFSSITTWDSSRTPGKGEIHREAKTLARADISAILAAMATPTAQKPGSVSVPPDADMLREAREEGRREGEGETMAACAQQLARLTTALRDYQAMAANAVAYTEQIGRILSEQIRSVRATFPETAMGGGLSDMPGIIAARTAFNPPAWAFHDAPAAAREEWGLPDIEDIPGEKVEILPVEPQEAPPATWAKPKALEGFPAFSPAATRMALALAERWPASITRRQWGTLARVAPEGGTFATALKALREAGYYEEAAQRITGTQKCHEFSVAFYHPDGAGSWESDFAMWRSFMPSTARKVLEAMRDLGGTATRARLAEVAGLAATGGTFATALKVLHDNELLTVSREGGVLHERSAIAAREAQRIGIAP